MIVNFGDALTQKAKILLVIAALFESACNVKVTVRAPGGEIDASLYVVEVADGYWLDRNDNGIIDIPNTREYVQRPLHTKLDFTGAALLTPAVWPIAEGASPDLGNEEGPWRWTFVPIDVPQDEATLSAPHSDYSSAPGRNDRGTLVAYSVQPEIEVVLFEGKWRVEFARMHPDSLDANPVYWGYANLVLEDWLIVQLGDSYSSGEGAAQRPSNQGIWADNGGGRHPDGDNYQKCIDDAAGRLSSSDWLNCVTTEAFGTPENLEHELAHRSSLSWGSLVAREVESWSKATSVTFVNLAASGARVKHLTAPYTEPPTVILPGDLGARVDSYIYEQKGYEDSFAVETVMKRVAQHVNRPLPPQLASLKNLVGARLVDAVLISMGGNDVGFSYAIVAYMLRDAGEDEDDDLETIAEAVLTGKWDEVAEQSYESRAYGDRFPKTPLPGLNGLATIYMKAAEDLNEAGISPANVYFIEYPDPLVASTDRLKGSHADDEVEVRAEPILTSVPQGTFIGFPIHDPEIGRKEQRHARAALIHPLNGEVARAAQAHGWNLVGQVVESMYRNPICSSDRLVNRFQESYEVQGDDRGTLHPNHEGHKRIANLVSQHLHIPNAYREAADYIDFLKAEGSNYPGRPKHRVFQVTNARTPLGQHKWLSVGLHPTSGRAFINVTGACNWNAMAVDVQAATDYTTGDDLIRVKPFRITDAVLRLVRFDEANDDMTRVSNPIEVARQVGYGTLQYSFSQADRGKPFVVVASTKINADSEPRKFARVHGKQTFADEYGTFDIRLRCPG